MTEAPWSDLAHKEIGVHETSGNANTQEILKFFQDSGHAEVHTENTAWCAAFVGAMLHRSGVEPTGSLMARSYLDWGVGLDAPKLGAVVVLWRGSPDSDTGHVGFVVNFDADSVRVLGGNQGPDGAVSIETFPKSRVLGYRWPKQSQKEKPVDPISLLSTFVGAVLPTTSPGTPSAGVTIPKPAAGSSLLSIMLGAVLAGVGSTGFGSDFIHTVSAIAGVALAALSALNHMGLISASNANTEALAEQLLKQISEAKVEKSGGPK
jgi:uncharacterized protein (TIGR02594 family)